MSTQPVVLSCSQCGEPVRGDEEFCGACGDFLGWRETSPAAPEVIVADVPVLTADGARDASPDGPAPVTPGGEPAGDPLAPLRSLATQAQERAEAARAHAMGAQVRLERARRRSTSARRRVERLEEQVPPAQERAHEAERAVDRAAAASRRASSAAKGTAVGADQQRLRELRSRVRAAGRAEKAARTASDAAQASVSTLTGVLAGARGEVAKAPAVVGQAQRERDVARAAADDAQRAAAAALAEVALQERLLALRATPRRVVAMPEQDALRAEAAASAEQAVEEVARRAEVSERRRLRRAEREDDRRSRAELAADDLELDGVLQGAGAAERAARTAERVVPIAAATPQDGDDDDPRAVLPVEVRRRAAVRASRLDLADDDGPHPCPSCAAGNSRQRTLCRSCGATLHLPEPEPPPPPVVWWRRLLRLDRPAERPFVPAGARPLPGGNPDTAAAVRRARVGGSSALRSGGRLRQVAPLVALAAVTALVAVIALTPLSGALGRLVGGGRDRVTERVAAEVELVPLSTRATSSFPGSTPALAVDGDLSTSWTSGAVPGVGEMLGLTFVDARDIVGIRLTAAAGSGRPRPAAVTIVSEGGAGVVLRLADTLREQSFPLDLRDIDDLQIRLDDLYPAEPAVPAGFAEVVVLTREAPRLNALRADR